MAHLIISSSFNIMKVSTQFCDGHAPFLVLPNYCAMHCVLS